MRHKPYPFFLALSVLLLASLACQALGGGSEPDASTVKTPEAAPPESAQPTPTTVSAQAPSVEPVIVASQGPGILCAGSTTGLSCLAENGWVFYNDQNSDLPNPYLYAGAVCPDGQIAIAHINGVVLFDGTTFKQVPETDNYSSPDGITCAANGDIWVAHFQGVSRYAGGQWTTYGSEGLASGESANQLVYDVKAAADGKVWVVTSRSVAVFENEAWTVYQEGQGFEGSRFFNAITVDSQGRPWAAHSNGVDVFQNGTWTSINNSSYSSPEAVAVDARGGVWLGTLTSGAYVFDGSTWTNHDRASEHLTSDDIAALAADSAGRIWFGTSYGLTVFDGADWATLLMSNSGLNDNDVRFVVVTKDGPSLPALVDKPLGSLTGKLEKADGTPLTDAIVEICVETLASTFSGDTPCSDQPFFLSTKTDAEGVFLIENVPAGYYVIVAETPTGWAQLTDEFGISSEKTLIPAGENYDIGTLTLEE
jgi:hypothetical protein